MENKERVLKDIYGDYFRIGVACENCHDKFINNEIGNPDKEKLMLKHFNSMTFGNELKPLYNMGWKSPEATEENLPFVINTNAKIMLDWCRENNMPVRGHVMVWHSQCANEAFCKGYKPVTFPTDPELLKEKPFLKYMEKLKPECYVDRVTMLRRLKSYISSMVDYIYANGYGNVVYAWDVVNEAIELEDKTETGLRNSYWYQVIGDDFIYWAFKFAREAVTASAVKYAASYGVQPDDKDGVKKLCQKLFYNDYNEFQPEKKAAIINALSRCGDGSYKKEKTESGETAEYEIGNRTHGSILSEGLIDGIGMQGHLSDNNDVEEYIAALYEYASLVDEVHVTELDVKCTCVNNNAEYNQAVFYKKLFEGFTKAKRDGVNLTAVVFWGLTDDNSWIRGANPLLFHADLSEKKAFNAVVYAVTGESLGEPEKVVYDLNDHIIDFEKQGETGAKPEEAGVKMRGFGEIRITDERSHSGRYSLENKLRFGDWCGPSINVSDFIGQTIKISLWVMSDAPEVCLYADLGGKDPLLAKASTADGTWTNITAEYRVPANVYSLFLYLNTWKQAENQVSPIYLDDISISLIGLREGFEDSANVASIRGVGHLPFCYITDKESVDGKGHSYCVTRQEKDATMKFNISQYVGRKVEISAFVKSSDNVIRMGLDGAEPVLFTEVKNVYGEWVEIKAVTELEESLNSAEIYIETDGNADFYVDDISVNIIK